MIFAINPPCVEASDEKALNLDRPFLKPLTSYSVKPTRKVSRQGISSDQFSRLQTGDRVGKNTQRPPFISALLMIRKSPQFAC
jgi:hypothetical protein